MFAPKLEKQKVYHFTSRWMAVQEAFPFDPTKPTSLLYKKDANGTLRLIGAMYVAPNRLSDQQLDARIPLSVARGARGGAFPHRAGGAAQRREARAGDARRSVARAARRHAAARRARRWSGLLAGRSRARAVAGPAGGRQWWARSPLDARAQHTIMRQLSGTDAASPFDALTPRERDVLRLIARGASNKQIAAELFLSIGTVKGYVSAILPKLGVADRSGAALLATKHGAERMRLTLLATAETMTLRQP
jgi:DNA-binding CsgD family transcriptional regulator